MSDRGGSHRPGAGLGDYPERGDDELPSWLDRRLSALAAPLRRTQASRDLTRVLGRVDRYSQPLRCASDSDLQSALDGLRRRLVIDGLEPDHVARAFALIREIADRKLGTPHYDVQLMGGWLMTQGMLAEMQTGEGKTLAATLPACTAALAGFPVHVISSNDYLVSRDSEEMRPIYETLGLTVGTVTEEEKDDDARRAAYACDVTYATGKVIAFDYLRDRIRLGGRRGLARRVERIAAANDRDPPLLRGLCFAVIDEADSVLIDEARTPLILSRRAQVGEQRRLLKQTLRLARSLERSRDFELEGASSAPVLTELGRERLELLAAPMGGLWHGPRRREEWVIRGLSALYTFERDRQYIVRDDRVQIVDALTGRVSPDRSWEGGLHQLIELKEGCTLTPPNETLARISYQQFFRRYLSVSGMTGTAREVAGELASTYGLHAVAVPPRRPNQRVEIGERLYRREADKWKAIVERVRSVRAAGRSVLIGTNSVASSEALSERLAATGLEHEVINARQDAQEAAVVARAGERGRITVATSMAGRGTDIKLDDDVREKGGLHVIATERAEARRVDRQLFGRCGRQGDPGSFEVLASLQDETLTNHFPAWLLGAAARWPSRGEQLPPWLAPLLLRMPHRAEERRHRRLRRGLMSLEEYLDRVLAFAGTRE